MVQVADDDLSGQPSGVLARMSQRANARAPRHELPHGAAAEHPRRAGYEDHSR
jgi:hypothetical protein